MRAIRSPRRLNLVGLSVLAAVLAYFLWPEGAALALLSQADLADRLEEGHRALRALDLPAAREVAEEVSKEAPSHPEVRYLLGRLAFYEGDYVKAKKQFEGTVYVDAQGKEDDFPSYVARVADAVEGLSERQSDHFRVFYDASSPDRILVDYALQTLEKAYQALGTELGHSPKERVRIEIFPSSQKFIQASSLKASEIETTGTVALCIYNKIMITTPRALALGYPWMDTLSHEYVHLLVAQKSRNTVPVWIHEGLARFFEVRWRGGRGAEMTRSSESLLAEAMNANRLVPFEKMSPSLAKLPSAEEAQLAFAQVQTVIEFLIAGHGLEGVHRLIDLMRDGRTDQQAIAAVFGMPFDRFEDEWKKFVQAKKLRVIKNVSVLPTILRAQEVSSGDEKPPAELEDPFMAENKALREYSRLGDLLRERGRFKAALIEYSKAEKSAPVESPALAVKIASTHMEAMKPLEAIQVLEQSISLYPSFAPSMVLLAEARLMAGQQDKALEAYQEANSVNPFDPSVHRGMAALYRAAGRAKEADAEDAVLAMLMGRE